MNIVRSLNPSCLLNDFKAWKGYSSLPIETSYLKIKVTIWYWLLHTFFMLNTCLNFLGTTIFQSNKLKLNAPFYI